MGMPLIDVPSFSDLFDRSTPTRILMKLPKPPKRAQNSL